MSAMTRPRIVVAGGGYWGRNVVRSFAQLGALAGICDPHPETVEALAREHGTRPVTLAEALAAPEVSGIAVAAPAEHHYQLARDAIAAGKHVLVEKPLALTVRQGEALVRQADAAGTILMVGHLLHYSNAFLKLRDMVREGALGRLRYVYSHRLNFGRIRREEDVLWSFAPHDISMILGLVGEDPGEVTATGAAMLHPTLRDTATVQLGFPGGVRGHVFVSWLNPFKEQKLVVVGDDAMAVFDDREPWERKLTLFGHKVAWRNGVPTAEGAAGQVVPLVPCEPLLAECDHFLGCIESAQAPRTDGREGLRVLSVLERASRSLAAQDAPPEDRVAGRDGFAEVTIHESAYVDDGVEIGRGTRIWHFSHILANTRIGRDCVLGQNVVAGPDVTIGDRCKIQNNVSIYKGVTLEDGVFCGPSCVFTNVNNPRAEIERKDEFRATLVRRGAAIGANATIVCGHTLGEYCFVAAGAVVTEDVPAFALVAGVPARRIGWMSHAGRKLGADLVCPETGRRYRESAPDFLEEIP